MKQYKFYDTDLYGVEELDICDEEYKYLIKICCKYSDKLSLRITNQNAILLEKLKPFISKEIFDCKSVYGHYGNDFSNINFYTVCDYLCEVIINNTKSVFEWINGWGYSNPEDPVFYRKDGSIFFCSIIHEGECTLLPRDDENVKEIISKKGWTEAVRDFSWDVNTTQT